MPRTLSPLALLVLGMLLLPMTGCLTSKLWEGDAIGKENVCIQITHEDNTHKVTFYLSPMQDDPGSPPEASDEPRQPSVHYDFFLKIEPLPESEKEKTAYFQGYLKEFKNGNLLSPLAVETEKLRSQMKAGGMFFLNVSLRRLDSYQTIHLYPDNAESHACLDVVVEPITAEEFEKRNSLEPLTSKIQIQQKEYRSEVSRDIRPFIGKCFLTPFALAGDMVYVPLRIAGNVISKTLTFLWE